MCTGSNDCCNLNNRCGLGEGDCDTNTDCMSGGPKGLVCMNWVKDSCRRESRTYLGYTHPGFSVTDTCCVLAQQYRTYYEEWKPEVDALAAEMRRR